MLSKKLDPCKKKINLGLLHPLSNPVQLCHNVRLLSYPQYNQHVGETRHLHFSAGDCPHYMGVHICDGKGT